MSDLDAEILQRHVRQREARRSLAAGRVPGGREPAREGRHARALLVETHIDLQPRHSWRHLCHLVVPIVGCPSRLLIEGREAIVSESK